MKLTASGNSISSEKIKLEAEIRSKSAELASAREQLENTINERDTSAGRLNEYTEAMEKARKHSRKLLCL